MRTTAMALVCAMVAGCDALSGPEGPAGADGAPGEKGDAGEQGIQGEQGDPGEQGAPGIVDPSLCHLVIEETGGSSAIASCDETTEFLLYGGCYTSGMDTTSIPGVDDPLPAIPFEWACGGSGNFTRAYAFCCPLP